MPTFQGTDRISVYCTTPRIGWVIQSLNTPIAVHPQGRVLLRRWIFKDDDCPQMAEEVESLMEEEQYRPGSLNYALTESIPSCSSEPTPLMTGVSMSSARAPMNPHRKTIALKFPLTFVCQMIPGLNAMLRGLKDIPRSKLEAQKAEIFAREFPKSAYYKSTFNNVFNVYKRALVIPDGGALIKKYIDKGQKSTGLWTTFKGEVDSAPHSALSPCSAN